MVVGPHSAKEVCSSGHPALPFSRWRLWFMVLVSNACSSYSAQPGRMNLFLLQLLKAILHASTSPSLSSLLLLSRFSANFFLFNSTCIHWPPPFLVLLLHGYLCHAVTILSCFSQVWSFFPIFYFLLVGRYVVIGL